MLSNKRNWLKNLSNFQAADKRSFVLPLLSAFIFILSTLAWLYNYTVTRFPGNNYFPENTPYIFISLALMYAGFYLLSGKNGFASRSIKEIFYLLCLFSLIAYATNAVQFTPFHPVDDQILHWEKALHVSIANNLTWIHSHPSFKLLLEWSYATLPYQMSILPLFVTLTGRYALLRDYYFIMLTTLLIGFTIYYFWPTTAPASVIQSPLFSDEQRATGLKFYQIHHYIQPKTMDGGLIALPSFHTIWAWLCLYLIRPWKIAFTLLLIINTFLILACVLLSWHYLVDVLLSVLILALCHSFNYGLARSQRRNV